jgi:hypothetical protein
VDARFAAVEARPGILDGLPGAIIGGFLDDNQIGEIRRTFVPHDERPVAPRPRATAEPVPV